MKKKLNNDYNIGVEMRKAETHMYYTLYYFEECKSCDSGINKYGLKCNSCKGTGNVKGVRINENPELIKE